jgi:hypothetical protein
VLTARALSKKLRIIAMVSEPENIKLPALAVRRNRSPAKFGGYLMADAVDTRHDRFVNDLSYHGTCTLVERAPAENRAHRARAERTLIVEVRQAGGV